MNIESSTILWKPPLIRLTQVPRADIDGGKPTTLYVQPEWILAIHRQQVRHSDTEGKPTGDLVDCTVVTVGATINYFVTESPEEVARLRDEAYGFKPLTKPAPPTGRLMKEGALSIVDGKDD